MNVRYKLKKIRHKAINFIEGGDQKVEKKRFSSTSSLPEKYSFGGHYYSIN